VVGLIRLLFVLRRFAPPMCAPHFYICRFFVSFRMKVVLFEIVSWLYVLRRFAPLMDTRIFTSAGFLHVLEWRLCCLR
jgi:hypothetical protein